jgi:hypothetical protein
MVIIGTLGSKLKPCDAYLYEQMFKKVSNNKKAPWIGAFSIFMGFYRF